VAAACAPVPSGANSNPNDTAAAAERRDGRGERSPDASRGRRSTGRAVVLADQGRRGDDLVVVVRVFLRWREGKNACERVTSEREVGREGNAVERGAEERWPL